jgi:oligopeptide/dipeptide ABC transporter ATP-binding protein
MSKRDIREVDMTRAPAGTDVRPDDASAIHDNDVVLEIKDLHTHFFTSEGVVKAVEGVDLRLRRGKTLAVVGESGCGKSITARSILQIVDRPGRIVRGEILLRRAEPDGRPGAPLDIASLDPAGKMMRSIRGNDISMIFQEPMSSLSPVHTIGNQIAEAIRMHEPVSKEEARERAVENLRLVGMSRADMMMDRYPFQLSGGMRQRAMIAMALAGRPDILIADEPTTALDVTTQAQILELIQELQAELGMSLMMITHDLGVVAEMADDVAVMYLGTVAEKGTVDQIFHQPRHPYTRALLRSVPRLGEQKRKDRLFTIRGTVPSPFNRPAACPYHTRCDAFMPGLCDRVTPPAIPFAGDHEARCLLYTNAAAEYRTRLEAPGGVAGEATA